MANPCKICDLPLDIKQDVDDKLLNGIPYPEIVTYGESLGYNFSVASLSRHRAGHLVKRKALEDKLYRSIADTVGDSTNQSLDYASQLRSELHELTINQIQIVRELQHIYGAGVEGASRELSSAIASLRSLLWGCDLVMGLSTISSLDTAVALVCRSGFKVHNPYQKELVSKNTKELTYEDFRRWNATKESETVAAN